MRMLTRKGRASAGSVVVGSGLVAITGVAVGRESVASSEIKTAIEPSPVEYAGVDARKACPEEVSKIFETTAHFKTIKSGGHGCESCHGLPSGYGGLSKH